MQRRGESQLAEALVQFPGNCPVLASVRDRKVNVIVHVVTRLSHCPLTRLGIPDRPMKSKRQLADAKPTPMSEPLDDFRDWVTTVTAADFAEYEAANTEPPEWFEAVDAVFAAWHLLAEAYRTKSPRSTFSRLSPA